MIVAGDVASAARAGPGAPSGLDHGADHLRILAHAQVIVGAPDHHVARPLRRMPNRVWEAIGDTLEIGKDAIATLRLQACQGITEIAVVVHTTPPLQTTFTFGQPDFFNYVAAPRELYAS